MYLQILTGTLKLIMKIEINFYFKSILLVKILLTYETNTKFGYKCCITKTKRSDNLGSKLWSPQFSQKTNEMHSGYYPECISYAFEISWPVLTLNDKKLSKSFGGASNINVQKQLVPILYAQSWIGIWLNERAPGPWLE